MLNIKLTLNKKDDNKVKDQISSVKRKKGEGETLEEAWIRILSMKNSEADQSRLREVREAMESGNVGRHPDNVSKRFSKAEALRLYSELAESQKEEKLRELVENTPSNYWLITDEQRLDEFLLLSEKETVIGYDLETNGLCPYTNHIVGYVVSLKEANIHAYIPVRHTTGEEQLDADYVREKLRPLLEKEGLLKIGHNINFDYHFSLSEGIELAEPIHDTLVIMHLLNENEPSYRLKDLTPKYLKIESDTFDTLFGKTPFNEIQLDVALSYAAKDGEISLKLFDFQYSHLNKLPKIKRVYEDIERPLIKVNAEMERVGFVLDLKENERQREEVEGKLVGILDELKTHFGDINFNSPAQLSELFYKELKLQKFLPKGAPLSTDVSTLKKLSKHHDGCKLLLEYRDLTKHLSGFIEALPKQMKPDGRIHPRFNQVGTKTGRYSSTSPNCQNQGKLSRKMLTAPKGKICVEIDIKSQENKILAHLSNDPYLIELFKEGKDFYSVIASRVFNKPYEECLGNTPERKASKVIVLGVSYKMSPKGLAEMLGRTPKEAEAIIQDFFNSFTEVKKWMDYVEGLAFKQGYIENELGRKRRLPELKSSDKWERAGAERQIVNYLCQGLAAYQTKLAILRMDEVCKRLGNVELVGTVHDSVWFMADENITFDELTELENALIHAYELRVPTGVDTDIGYSFGVMKEKEEWFK